MFQSIESIIRKTYMGQKLTLSLVDTYSQQDKIPTVIAIQHTPYTRAYTHCMCTHKMYTVLILSCCVLSSVALAVSLVESWKSSS